MADLTLYYHPLSSYCWKVLIPLYENDTLFFPASLGDAQAAAAWQQLWPLARFPILVDGDVVVAESSIIIEWLDLNRPGPLKFIPDDPANALEARLMDRLFDDYVMTPMQTIVADRNRPEDTRDPFGVEAARTVLGKAYGLIEDRMAGCPWAAGGNFTIADCAAFPALFYADKVMPFRKERPALAAYLGRLEDRASVQRVLEEKEPYWAMFPYANG